MSPQTATLRPYLNAVRATLQAALCLENFSSQVVERHNKPEVEVRYGGEAAAAAAGWVAGTGEALLRPGCLSWESHWPVYAGSLDSPGAAGQASAPTGCRPLVTGLVLAGSRGTAGRRGIQLGSEGGSAVGMDASRRQKAFYSSVKQKLCISVISVAPRLCTPCPCF